jgi:hypothetical protein
MPAKKRASEAKPRNKAVCRVLLITFAKKSVASGGAILVLRGLQSAQNANNAIAFSDWATAAGGEVGQCGGSGENGRGRVQDFTAEVAEEPQRTRRSEEGGKV